MLAPNSPDRAQVRALGRVANLSQRPIAAQASAADPPPRPASARITWALLLARIYACFPLLCPQCGGTMRIIAFITEPPAIKVILTHLGEPTAPPRIAPARGPPLWEAAGTDHDPSAAPALPPTPAFEFDQRLTW